MIREKGIREYTNTEREREKEAALYKALARTKAAKEKTIRYYCVPFAL